MKCDVAKIIIIELKSNREKKGKEKSFIWEMISAGIGKRGKNANRRVHIKVW